MRFSGKKNSNYSPRDNESRDFLACDGLLKISHEQWKREKEEEETQKKSKTWGGKIFGHWYESIYLPSDIIWGIFSTVQKYNCNLKSIDWKAINELPHSSDRCNRWAFCMCINERCSGTLASEWNQCTWANI